MMKIQILGTGCSKCQKLTENARAAIEQSGVECEIEKITDISEITRMGVMMPPALAINGQVKTSGRIPDVDTIRSLING